MKILHVISGLKTGGAERMLAKLAIEMKRVGHESVVACLGPRGGAADLLEAAGIPVHYLGAHKFLGILPALLRLAALARRTRPDGIQGWMVHGNLAALWARKFAPSKSTGSVPVYWSVHQAVYSLRFEKPTHALLIRLSGWLAKSPRRIIQVSQEAAKQHVRFGYPLNSTVIIPIGFDTVAFQPLGIEAKRASRSRLGLEPGDTDLDLQWVGLVARADPKKDIGLFIEVAGRLAARHPQARFLVLGRGHESDDHPLRRKVRALGLEPVFRFQPETQKAAQWIASLDVLVSSSYTEAFPNVIGEAMACAVPCVVTDVGDCAYLLGDAGKVVRPRDSHALGEALSAVLSLPEADRARMGAHGRDRILREFSIASVTQRYLEVYRSWFTNAGKTSRAIPR